MKSLRDILVENLQTHNKLDLRKRLTKIFPDIEFGTFSHELIQFTSNKTLTEQERKYFEDIVRFFGYFISREKNNHYTICPYYSTNKTQYIYNDCNSICYHLTTEKEVKSILVNGLRCKNGKNDSLYRFFPNRIYVIATDKDINSIAFKNDIKHILWELDCEPDDLILLKIDISGKNLNFYHDDSMRSPYAFYTYTNIPKDFITNLGPLTNILHE